MNNKESSKILKFPKDFLWGTATSAHQIEGDNFNSDWWNFEQNKKIKTASGKACNSYELWKKDHSLIKDMNNNAYRFSIEWAKIEPTEGKFDEEVIQHYTEILADLKAKKIKVMLTLHHFSNPTWFLSKGGWVSFKSVKYFKRYIRYVLKHLGGLVDFWITINEPGVYVDLSYLKGKWPPQEKNPKKALLAYINMARAHRMAYKLIHKKLPGSQVGFAMNVMSFASYHKHRLIELLYVHFADRFVNHSFYDITKKKHDFLGINYYFRVRLRKDHGSLKPVVEEVREQERELSDLGWVIYPHGIFDVLMDVSDFKLPIYITENGIAAKDDERRQRFLIEHLKEIHHAIQAGVDVRGYFHWSLLDNFEWADGYDPKFGLVQVNFKNFERKIKISGKMYAEIAKTNSICEQKLKSIT
ncbi:MAG: glycoside hydrolase family 1 protein [Patescibacteria group bacterium]